MIQNQIRNGLNLLKARLKVDAYACKYNYEQPLRSDLLSIDQLEKHARVLAQEYEIDPNPGKDLLLPRLDENETILLETNELLTEAVASNLRIAPASEWLLDNFYRIEEQVHIARRDYSKKYSKELPHLLKGELAGYPRVYDLVREMIVHTDANLDEESLKRFVAAYQTVSVLNLAELWAVAIMLRLALIENLRRISSRIATVRSDRDLAGNWADKVILTAETKPKNMVFVVSDLANSYPPMSNAFVAEFSRRLEGQSHALALPLTWIEEQLSDVGKTIVQMIREDIQQESADTVSVSNSISSLKFINSADWKVFVEDLSVVEKALRMDPAGIYGQMNFATRDRYRHIVEKIARGSLLSEEEVALLAVKLARERMEAQGKEARDAHVGFFFIDKGLSEIEIKAGMSRSIKELLNQSVNRSPFLYYIGTIALITITIAAGVLAHAYKLGAIGWMPIMVAVLTLISSSRPGVGLANWLTTLIVRPHALPKMDFSDGIVQSYRTMVVVPSILNSPEKAAHLSEGLELCYLANREKNIYFGLLLDLVEAKQEIISDDEQILLAAGKEIEALNKKYNQEIFFLFPRKREFNPSEGSWRGRERKRGIIEDFNLILRGGSINDFFPIIGDVSVLPDIKYVITLDEDTKMPYDSARLLIETMAHPLNHPVFDPEKQCVMEGYSILHPRLSASMPESNLSRFMELFGDEPGVDPYTRESSDVYQDLFGEGSFSGKGIYDVDAFSLSLSRRFPDNLILSHDLLEGSYARAALVSDVLFYENYPHSYISDIRRRHRWIRGDWQIVNWLLSTVPGPAGLILDNPISGLSRWKIFDNLRRSLMAPAQISLLLLGWLVLPQPVFWTFVVIGIIFSLPLLACFRSVINKSKNLPLRTHLYFSRKAISRYMAQAGLNLIFLPYEAFFSIDAVARTWLRMVYTHKHLLEWNTASSLSSTTSNSLKGIYQSMWIAPVLAISVTIGLVNWRYDVLYTIWPLLVLWTLAPAIAWRISLPLEQPVEKFSEKQMIFLHKLSRRTWRFFETFVGPGTNWLPPDNFQEDPLSVTANGTSPTNMGFSLLANLTSYDFGYISAGKLLKRSSFAIETMNSLQRFQGHFFNWYDIKLLEPMRPKYISTVDSGNLVGYLLTLQEGFIELKDQKILPEQVFSGFRDTLEVLKEVATEIEPSGEDRDKIVPPQLIIQIDELLTELQSPPTTLSLVWMLLDKQSRSVTHIIDSFDPEVDDEVKWWFSAYAKQLQDHLDDLILMAPWLLLPMWAMLHPPMKDILAQGSAEDARKLDVLQSELQKLDNIASLKDIPDIALSVILLIDQIISYQLGENNKSVNEWFVLLRQTIKETGECANKRIESIDKLVNECNNLADIKYDFLFDEKRQLFSIGYNVDNRILDESYYDLLASEARLASYVAIAQGKIKQKNWFSLGRMLTSASGELALLSWGGTMFEYLMPQLVMPTYENTLLNQTYKAAVRRQIDYGEQRSVPWGISESGYNMTDASLVYQYRAFGVPGLGLKRGLSEDLVITPYASAMALMVEPVKACLNMQKMVTLGYMGLYGFWEAIDYTPSRLTRDQISAIVKSFMAHHQGMILLSLAYVLLDQPMQRRFLANPLFGSADLLLQERVPKTTPFYPHAFEITAPIWRAGMRDRIESSRAIYEQNTLRPEVHLLSNGKYNVMITSAGGGYSMWNEIAVTRWHADPTLDNDGIFFYIRDLDSGEVWSAGYQPVLKDSEVYAAIFPGSMAEFKSIIHDIYTNEEVVVSPEDDVELRSIKITNRSWRKRRIELTSYAEVVLNTPAADESHPTFSKLFVQTEIVRNKSAILCTRRPSSKEEKTPWMLHMMAAEKIDEDMVSYETDRSKFIGRGRTVADPVALIRTSKLSDSEGSVLDPIVSIRYIISINPGETARVNFITGIAHTRDIAMDLIDKYSNIRMADRAYNLAWTHNQMMQQQLGIIEADIWLFERLASAIIYPNPTWRASQSILLSNHFGQSTLWAYRISGDLPIVLLRTGDRSNIELTRQLLRAHAYWHMMGLSVDLIIWNEDRSGYRQDLQDTIMGLISSTGQAGILDRPGGIFVINVDQISEEAKTLFQTVASAVFTDDRGTFEDQMERQCRSSGAIPLLKPVLPLQIEEYKPIQSLGEDLIFFNGLGGFTQDGREYIIRLPPGQTTPVPWSNVIANPHFGTVISESGGAYTWSQNAQQFRLTPWYNDPVSDISGEAVYIRDEETGQFWSPTAMPARGSTPYSCRHGFGYSVFEHKEFGIASELWVYVALDAPVKFCVLKLRNESGVSRRLSVTSYAELVLGETRSESGMHIITQIDTKTGALLAKNPYNMDFPGRIVFMDVNQEIGSFSGDRTEFLGRNGKMSKPAALAKERLSNRVGPAMDPCMVMQLKIDLANGQNREIVFTLGTGRNVDDVHMLIKRFHGSGPALSALEAVWSYWNRTLGAVRVNTPDQALDVLANGWLVYQTLACRIWARSGFYQSSGAFGFRDQLQDIMALIYAEPELARNHILLCAAQQFLEGDVLHWWHPPSGRGVRTHSSDDYLWLPLATHRYVTATGDTGVLDEVINFIEGRPLNPGEDAYFDLPTRSEKSATLYEHCVRAIKNGLKFGLHGLPLMGSGDWNDAMNRVGYLGSGESVWLAFFMYQILTTFSEIALLRGDTTFEGQCRSEAAALRQKIEEFGWDGKWYLRAYFDSGEPLGSHANPECQIDSISQAWSVLSAAGDIERSKAAMEEVDRKLVKRDAKIIALLEPPFDKWELDPGYIKGYIPGVRENGGQYTHAAVWTTMAFAALGDSARAWELFSMINPLNHGSTSEQVATYKAEPYVVAADVYAVPPHTGRGGWTWYSGAAGWMYRLIVESLLGLRLEVDRLQFKPCIPANWESFQVHYRYHETFYHITIKQMGEAPRVTVDGLIQSDGIIHLVDDRKEHSVEVRIG